MKNLIFILVLLFAISGYTTAHAKQPNTSALELSSNFPARQVAECLLAHYQGERKVNGTAEFFTDILLTPEGGYAFTLLAPEMITLAVVSDQLGGSKTRYLNNKNIPRAEIFDNAVNKCQLSPIY